MTRAIAHHALLMASGSLWTPANLPVQPQIWVDWDSAVTNVSGAASAWSNSKGSIGGSFSQSTAGNRPAILSSVAGIGGKRALSFDGTNDWIRMDSAGAAALFQNTGAGWCFSVITKRGTDGAGTARASMYAPHATTGATRFQSAVGSAANANANILFVKRLDADSTSSLIGSTAPGSWVIRCDLMDWANGDGFIYLNGSLNAQNLSLTTSGNTSNTGGFNSRVTLGANAATGTADSFADIDAACYIIGAGSLPSAANRERMEGWAAWKLGLQSILPIGHPYKTEPPYV